MGALTPRRLAKAASPKTNPLTLATYLWHPIPWVARTAAANPSTPVWARRWASRRTLLLDIMLSSRDTAPDFLARHSKDHELSPSMLDLIARNPKTDAETLERVAQHCSTTLPVLYTVIHHPAAPGGLVEDVVLNAVTRYGANPVEAANLYRVAAARGDLSPVALSWLAHNCSSGDVLALVSRHPNTPEADAVVAALSSSVRAS